MLAGLQLILNLDSKKRIRSELKDSNNAIKKVADEEETATVAKRPRRSRIKIEDDDEDIAQSTETVKKEECIDSPVKVESSVEPSPSPALKKEEAADEQFTDEAAAAESASDVEGDVELDEKPEIAAKARK